MQHPPNVANTVSAQLERMPTDGSVDGLKWDSDAAEGFREVVKKLPTDLRTLETRYATVARAMEAFTITLRACKAEVARGYADAHRASADAAAAAHGVRNMQDHDAAARAAANQANATGAPGTAPSIPQPWPGPD